MKQKTVEAAYDYATEKTKFRKDVLKEVDVDSYLSREEICEMIDIKLACEEAIEKKDKEVRNAVRWAAAGWLTSIALFGILVAAFVFK